MYTFTLPLVLIYLKQIAYTSTCVTWLYLLGLIAIINCIYGFLNPSIKDLQADINDIMENKNNTK